jgi:hypothetical protein
MAAFEEAYERAIEAHTEARRPRAANLDSIGGGSMESETIRLCTQVRLPEELEPEAADAALESRADNLRLGPMPASLNAPIGLRAVIEVAKRWEPGKVLSLSFLDGDQAVQQRVAQVAEGWLEHANLRFDFGAHQRPDIRISFAQVGSSWSYVGTDAKLIEQGRATMNFGWLTPATPADEYDRVVLHEFGHAVGLVHEHQHPEGGIPWDEPRVYEWYGRQGWSREDVDRNVFRVHDRDTTNFSEFDEESIMLYSVPEELTVGDYAIGWNRSLSELDRSFIAQHYPRAQATPELAVGGGRIGADIGADRETDEFTFQVEKRSRHIITTEGPTNVVMSLHGPDDPALLRAFDDDSGKARNARIMRTLNPGRYWIRVRHSRRVGRGAYTLGVKRARA